MSLQNLGTAASVIGVVAVLQLGPDIIRKVLALAKDVRSMSAGKENLSTRLACFRDVLTVLEEHIGPANLNTTTYRSLLSRFPLDAFRSKLDQMEARLHPETTFWGFDLVERFLWTYSKSQFESDIREFEHFREAAFLALEDDQSAWAATFKSQLLDSERNILKLSTELAGLQRAADSVQHEWSPISSAVSGISNDTQTLISDVLFDRLPRVAQARYDDASSLSRRGPCAANTREAVLANLKLWASDNRTERLYWLNGMAGTGKTTIAYSLCDILNNTGSVVASFFCSRSIEDCTKVELIIPTIAYEFARRSREFRAGLCTILRNEPTVGSRVLSRQFQDLLANPFGGTLPEKPFIAIIDALDECANQKAVHHFLSILLRSSEDVPIKFLITSRPEQVIRGKFNGHQPETHVKCILHDIEKSLVDADIRLYITEELVNMVDGRSDFEASPEDWPPNHEVDKLVRLADRLFIVAATMCHYISGKGSIRRRLADMANTKTQHSSEKTRTIDALYTDILSRSFEGLTTQEKRHTEMVLSTVITVLDPLNISGLGMLLELNRSDVKIALSHLHSVVNIRSGEDSPLSPFHASFPDFMMDQSRAGDFFQDNSRCHGMLASRCFKILNSLDENVCGLETRRPNRHIDCKVIESCIPEPVRYACLHWVSHLTATLKDNWCDEDDIRDQLEQFFRFHLLSWFEHLSLLGNLRVAVDSLSNLEIWTTSAFPRLSAVVLDARRFIVENFEVITQNSMEIYRSALVWLPMESHIRKNYSSRQSMLPRIVSGLRKSWGTCEQVIKFSSGVNSVDFSPDGTRIVSGSNDGIVQIWKTASGEEEIRLGEHSGWVRSVAFSPDGTRIVSGSDDGSVRIWKTGSAEEEKRLDGHSDWVRCVSFSPDGAQVVSASDDHVVQIWRTASGQKALRLEGHSDLVRWVAFSPNGTRIISASDDLTVRMWKSASGEEVMRLDGHLVPVQCVAFSQDGNRIVTASNDHTVRIWQAASGREERRLAGHSDRVRCAAFSPDGTRIVSGSDDETVRVWNATTGEEEMKLDGHSDWVRCVAFSPDGNRIVSGSNDHTVRIWQPAGGVDERRFDGHSGLVSCLAFSSDCTRIVSGSDDMTVRVWQAASGEEEMTLEGHADWVRSVAFSTDGTRIVSGSNDEKVKIWRTASGELETELNGLLYHNVPSIASSLGGTQLEYDLRDTMKRSDALVGTFRAQDYTDHTQTQALDGHNNVVYYPSNSKDWIMSNDDVRECFIPGLYRDFESFDFQGSTVCFGYPSGRLVILHL